MTSTAGSRPSRRCGSAARRSRTALHSVPSMAVCQAASSTSSNRPAGGPPELTTSRSRPPNASTAAATAAAGPSGVERSAGTASAPSRSAAASSRSLGRAVRPTTGSLGPEHLGDGAAEAAAAATDERATVAQSEIHDRLSWRACRVGTGSPPRTTGRRTRGPTPRPRRYSVRPASVRRVPAGGSAPMYTGTRIVDVVPRVARWSAQGGRRAGGVEPPGVEPGIGRRTVAAVRRRAVADPGDPVGHDRDERDALVARPGRGLERIHLQPASERIADVRPGDGRARWTRPPRSTRRRRGGPAGRARRPASRPRTRTRPAAGSATGWATGRRSPRPPAAGRSAGAGAGKNRSQGLTRAAPRKMPTRNVAIGTTRLTAFERTGSTRNSP